MSIHLMIISMDGNEPTVINEKILDYLGFNDKTKGKQVYGKTQEFAFSITPYIAAVYVKILDESIDCVQLTVVFENVVKDPHDTKSVKEGMDFHRENISTALVYLAIMFGLDLDKILKLEFDEKGNYGIIFPEISEAARNNAAKRFREDNVGTLVI